MSRKWLKRILWIVGVVAVAVGLRLTVFAPKPVPVSVYVVKSGKVEETVTNSKAGTVKVRQRSNLSPEIGGRITFIGAREGTRVKAGTLLLKIDDSAYRASLALSERAVQSARGTMEEACVASDLAQRTYDRNNKLHGQGIVS
ncbi:MAG TPA: biotin/lipoyl-binding protein, partial [Acidobacteriota bacterium]|nr:biotin/lipoyl-binding protein [Acidobacteriota bacterium]